MTSSLSAFSADISGVVAGAAGRIVGVHAGRGRPASGIVFGEGLVVTAEEVLPEDGEVTIVFADGRSAAAEPAGRDPSTDVALFKTATGPAEPWVPAATPAVGGLAIGIGRGDASPLAALGLVSETGPVWTSMQGGRIDARIKLSIRLPRRAEGGAVLAADAGLIGMMVSGPRRSILAIPAATIARAVTALTDKGYVARGYLGLSLQRLNRTGLIVANVESGGPAAAAGFVVGDIVTTWNGEPVGGVGEIARRLGSESIGKTVTLGVLRAGELTARSVTIGERPMTR